MITAYEMKTKTKGVEILEAVITKTQGRLHGKRKICKQEQHSDYAIKSKCRKAIEAGVAVMG